VRDGDILAAEFNNRGKTYRALRYTDPSGQVAYFAPNGNNLRKAFAHTVEFSRISSGFSLARMHPILNRLRAHKGVDYAAPSGTPVKATSDAIVSFVGHKRGYGNVVELQHGKHFSTLYGICRASRRACAADSVLNKADYRLCRHDRSCNRAALALPKSTSTANTATHWPSDAYCRTIRKVPYGLLGQDPAHAVTTQFAA